VIEIQNTNADIPVEINGIIHGVLRPVGRWIPADG
jgi:hypothetical protein